jgi:hypothetical protein
LLRTELEPEFPRFGEAFIRIYPEKINSFGIAWRLPGSSED